MIVEIYRFQYLFNLIVLISPIPMIIVQPNTSAFLHSIYFGFYLIHPGRWSKKSIHVFAGNFYFHQHLLKVNKAVNNLICFLMGASEKDKPCWKNYTKAAFPVLKKYFFLTRIFSKFFKTAFSNQYLNHPVAIMPT